MRPIEREHSETTTGAAVTAVFFKAMAALRAVGVRVVQTCAQPIYTVNAKVTAVTVNEKVVVAGREGAGPVPVTVIVTVPAVAVDVAESAKVTVQDRKSVV